MKAVWIAVVACALGCAVCSPAAEAATELVVWSFGNGADGQAPYAGLIAAGKPGTFYGTTSGGGAYHNGTLFSLDPATKAETVLWSFGNGFDGAQPYASVIDINGELFGTTTAGGNDDVGTVFSFNPETDTETMLHSFDITDGQGPLYLTRVKGKLYGTTPWGAGPMGFGDGTVYAYNLKTGATKMLYAFGDGTDGINPYGALVDVNGTLYGTASAGGIYGYGTVFSFNPKTHAGTVLWSFGNGTDGQTPETGLIVVKGMLYGTTHAGGAYGYGAVFALNPKTDAETVLWSFGNGTDGQNPNKSLIDVKGTLYGTTVFGGIYGAGTAYSFNLKTGAETVLWSFGDGTDGEYPNSSLMNLKGTLYGTTTYGGSYGGGTVFSLAP
ncbi:MAG TPA: choice-of-anchor tandem repeat GloVer-containing protein [Rhizomicrobium sp.]|jgi:uncharacterized repeat protein (TIGR03803 family)|nr:choice-of-anchor tandem repeat GloVer-containing protein [Rhizomicrobium sp.]